MAPTRTVPPHVRSRQKLTAVRPYRAAPTAFGAVAIKRVATARQERATAERGLRAVAPRVALISQTVLWACKTLPSGAVTQIAGRASQPPQTRAAQPRAKTHAPRESPACALPLRARRV